MRRCHFLLSDFSELLGLHNSGIVKAVTNTQCLITGKYDEWQVCFVNNGSVKLFCSQARRFHVCACTLHTLPMLFGWDKNALMIYISKACFLLLWLHFLHGYLFRLTERETICCKVNKGSKPKKNGSVWVLFMVLFCFFVLVFSKEAILIYWADDWRVIVW